MVSVVQKEDLAGASFINNNTTGLGGIVIRTDAGSTVGTAIAAAALNDNKPTSMTHAWNSSGDGSGILTLTFPDSSTLTCALSALPSPASC